MIVKRVIIYEGSAVGLMRQIGQSKPDGTYAGCDGSRFTITTVVSPSFWLNRLYIAIRHLMMKEVN